MSKQTAVNFLIDNLIKLGYLHSNDYGQTPNVSKVIQQAKEMEKKQIIDACNQIEVIGLDHELPGEQYYNETFNKKETNNSEYDNM